MSAVKVVGLRVALPMTEEMCHVNDGKGGGRGIDGRIASHEGAINHIVSFPGVKHITGEKNG